jgi:hypothetical protein
MGASRAALARYDEAQYRAAREQIPNRFRRVEIVAEQRQSA